MKQRNSAVTAVCNKHREALHKSDYQKHMTNTQTFLEKLYYTHSNTKLQLYIPENLATNTFNILKVSTKPNLPNLTNPQLPSRPFFFHPLL